MRGQGSLCLAGLGSALSSGLLEAFCLLLTKDGAEGADGWCSGNQAPFLPLDPGRLAFPGPAVPPSPRGLAVGFTPGARATACPSPSPPSFRACHGAVQAWQAAGVQKLN